nr:unnamed protein product [Spirometra erinaceieuropaei]
MADEYADLKQMLHQQLKLMEALTVKLSNSSMGQSSAAGGSQSVDHIAGSITEFLYDPQAHITFDSWYKRYEDLFSVDLAAQDDAWKVRLLLRKLGPAEHERYANFLLPKNPREVAFTDTVKTLSQIFGEQSSLFNSRFQCLQLCKRDSDDFITYAGIVNLLDLLGKILTLDPDRRLTAAQALAHPYFATYHDESDKPVAKPFMDELSNMDNLTVTEWKSVLSLLLLILTRFCC